MRPLAIDLYCGLGGWTDGLLAEGFEVVGFDNERHEYGDHRYPGRLVLQDILTLNGAQLKDAALIVASPPCQEYSYMAMPWTRAKQIAAALRGEGDFPEGYTGSRTVAELNQLFDACFRIQREASEALGRHIPMVVENVRGAQPWVGKAQWNYGSYYLWGDVPALMPITAGTQKFNPDGSGHAPGSWFAVSDSKNRGVKAGDVGWRDRGPGRQLQDHAFKSQGMNWSDRTRRGQDFTRVAGEQAIKNSGGSWFNVAHNTTSGKGRNPDGRKQPGKDRPNPRLAPTGNQTPRRKMASAMIAKIPYVLAEHIAKVYYP